jgi:hypothetical protein
MERLSLQVIQSENFRLALGVRQGGETLVCARADGELMPPRSLTHEFIRVARRVKGIPTVRFHDLLAQPCHSAVAGGHPSEGGSRASGPFVNRGHLGSYSHVSESMQEDAAARLDSAFQSAISSAAGLKKGASVAIWIAIGVLGVILN